MDASTTLARTAAALLCAVGCAACMPASEPAEADHGHLPDVSLPALPTISRATSAREDADFDGCELSKGVQRVDGRLTSSAKKKVDYVITVSWTAHKKDVRGRGIAVLRGVEPGETRDFTVRGLVGSGAETCVYSVMYGRID